MPAMIRANASHRASRLSARAVFHRLGHTATIAFAALFITGCKTDIRNLETPERRAEAEQRERDELAGAMVRLGYDRWAAACGYELGRKGRPRSDVAAKCLVDFDAALATEAGTAETTEIGSVHEGAGRRQRPNTVTPSSQDTDQ